MKRYRLPDGIFLFPSLILLISGSLHASQIVLSNESVSLRLTSLGTVMYSLPRLHVSGQRIVDSDGREVIPKGMGYTAPWHYSPYTPLRSDLETIKSYGVNTIRLAWSWKHLEETKGLYNETYLQTYLDPVMTWCEELKIYVVLDLHTWKWGDPSYQSGVPLWVTKDGLWNDSSIQQSWFDAWTFVLNRYKNNKALLGFDPINDINLDGTGLHWDQSHWNTLLDEIANYVAEVVPSIVLFAETTPWAQATPWVNYWKEAIALGPLKFSNVVYTVHIYDAQVLGNWSHCRVVTCDEWANLLGGIFSFRDSLNVSIHASEFGDLNGLSGQQLTNAVQSYDNLLSLLKQDKIGWFYYTYGLSGQPPIPTEVISLLEQYL